MPLPALPEDDRHSLAAWLNDLNYDAGRARMAWAERVKRQIAEGRARPMGVITP